MNKFIKTIINEDLQKKNKTEETNGKKLIFQKPKRNNKMKN